MNLQKENKSSNNQDIKQILVEILNEYKVDSMKYLKKKNIFKGDFLLWLKHSKIILIFFQTNKENSLHIIDLNEEMVLKSAKINLNFVKKDSKLDFEVKKIVVSSDEKLISFVGKRHIAIEEISKIKTRKKADIEVTHTTCGEDKFLCFQFGNFEDYYATMDNSYFRFYQYGNSVSFHDINLIGKINIDTDYKPKMKSFCFGPKHEFGWQIFSIFFINTEGKMFIVCPIFPLSFKVSHKHLENMSEFLSSLNYFEVTNKDQKLQNILNNNLLHHIKISMDTKDSNNKITSHKYLKEMNKDSCLTQLIIFDKRDQSTFIGDTSEIMSNFKYDEIFVLNSFPLCILRKSNLGLIDIIVLNDIINPIRNEEIATCLNINCYLLETILLPTRECLTNQKNLHFLKKIGVKTRINTSSFSLNHNIYVNYINDLLKIDLSYINNLSSFYKNKNSYDLEFYMKSKVSKIYKFNYSNLFDKLSKNTYKEILGYYGIILSIDLKAIIFSNDNEFDIEEIEELKKQTFMLNEWQRINVLAREAQLQPIDFKSLYENLNNAFKIQVLMPDILGKKMIIDDQALKYMESGENKRAGNYIYNKVQEMIMFYENIFNKNYECFKLKIKSLNHIFSESKTIYNLLEPSLASITKNINEITELDKSTKLKKKKIEEKLEKIKSFIKQINDSEPHILQKKIQLHEKIKGNTSKLHSLQTKLTEISEQYEKLMKNKWTFILPFNGLKPGLKKKIFEINNSIMNISQRNMENLNMVLYMKSDK